jgi:hypothetical protein
MRARSRHRQLDQPDLKDVVEVGGSIPPHDVDAAFARSLEHSLPASTPTRPESPDR